MPLVHIPPLHPQTRTTGASTTSHIVTIADPSVVDPALSVSRSALQVAPWAPVAPSPRDTESPTAAYRTRSAHSAQVWRTATSDRRGDAASSLAERIPIATVHRRLGFGPVIGERTWVVIGSYVGNGELRHTTVT